MQINNDPWHQEDGSRSVTQMVRCERCGARILIWASDPIHLCYKCAQACNLLRPADKYAKRRIKATGNSQGLWKWIVVSEAGAMNPATNF